MREAIRFQYNSPRAGSLAGGSIEFVSRCGLFGGVKAPDTALPWPIIAMPIAVYPF
jgi:hypothetical protein